jgi:hypothetical protein
MTQAEEISQAIATVERQISEAKSETAKKVLAKKLERLVNDLKKAKPSLTTLPKARKTVKSLNTKAFEELVEKLSKNPEYSFLKDYSQERLLRDKARTAKPKGYRFKGDNDKKPTPAQVKKGLKDGSVYYEGRPIRSDISRDIRLKTGGNLEKGYNNPEKSTHVLHIDGFNWYLEKIDSTHFYMSNNPNSRGMAHHVDQHRGEPYYEEVRSWLKSTKYAEGGNFNRKYLVEFIGIEDGEETVLYDVIVEEANKAVAEYSAIQKWIRDKEEFPYKKFKELKKSKIIVNEIKSVNDKKVDELYKKSGFINTDSSWQFKLLEMIGDGSREAYQIYNSLSEKEKEMVIDEQFDIDNSLGEGDMIWKTSKENLEVLLAEAKNGKKYAEGGNTESKIADAKIKFRKLAKSNNFDIVVAEGRYEVELDSNDKVKSIVHPNGNRHKASECPIYKKYSKEINSYLAEKFAEGGRIDLFEDYENIPPNVQKILDKYAEEFGEDFGSMDYSDMADMHKEIVAVGYTFESGLDNMPYGLRPVGVKLNELRDYEDEPDDEMAKGGGIDIKNRQTVVAYKNDLRASYVIDKKNRGFKITRFTGSVLMPFGTDYTDDWRKWFKNNTDNFEILMATGGTIDNSYLGTTLIRKGHYGWMAKTTTKKQIKGYDWEITTMKRSSGDLVSTATGGKSEDKGSYSTFMYSPFEDPSYRLVSSKPKMVNEKAVTKQHEEALKIFIEKLNEMKSDKMATGGKVDGKTYNIMHNVGKSKYVVNFHDGVKKHSDGSRFFDIEIFKNLKELKAFTKKLDSEGYKKQMKHGGSTKSHDLDYYTYETAKVTISWRGKTQPFGFFKSAREAFNKINEISQTNAGKADYVIVTPDGNLNVSDFLNKSKFAMGGSLEESEYLVSLQNPDNGEIETVNVMAKSKEEAENTAIEESGYEGWEIAGVEKMATGGSIKASDKKFKEIQDLGSEQYYTRYFGKFETEKGEIELMVVATIRDLEDYVSEDDLPKEGNFQLSFDIVPKEEFISEDLLEQANDEDYSVSDDSLVNIVNYMGGLRYEPSEKVHFKTQEKALKHLMSIPLNKEINRNGEYPDNIIYSNYNRAGSTNEMYLDYMIGASDKFFKSGGNVGKSKKNKYLYIPNQDISKIVLKSKQVIGKNRILDGAYVKGGKQTTKSVEKYSFPVGSVVWDKTHKRYGVVLNNFGNDLEGDGGEIRLDSDGVQPIFEYDKKFNRTDKYNLVPYGSKQDKGNGDLTDIKESGQRLIDGRKEKGDEEYVKYYQDAFGDVIAGKIDGKPHKTSSKMAKGGNIESEVEELYRGYASAILFAEMDYETDEPLDYNYSISDFDEETEKESKELLRKFYTENRKAIEESGLDLDTIGNDIWYTRAGHGAGFFDHSLDSDVEEALTKGAKALGEHPDVETYDGKISVRGGRVFQYKKGGKITKEDALQEAIDMGVDFNKDFHAQSFGNELSELAKKVGYRKSPSSSGSTGRAFFYHLQKIYDKKKFATGGSVSKYIDGMTEAEIIKATVVYDNGGETLDRYTVFTPDGSVYGMSETGGGFNQYVGDDSEVEKGSHLGKRLKSVPKGIKSAVLDRMKEEFADGGMMYAKGGNTNYSYIEKDKIDRVVTNSGKEYGSNVILDGAYVTDRVRTPKMSRTQFEDETFEYGQGGNINFEKHIWEGWTVGDFIQDLEPTFNQIMSGRSWQKPFTTKQQVKEWCMDNQPYYKKHIPEVVNYFWGKVDGDKMAQGGGVEYQNIKKEKEKMTTELLEKCGVFFAFSDKQFDENKTPLKEGEKYVSIGGGGYMPKGSIKAFEEGMKAINSYGKQKVKKGNLQEAEILYELQNHECFYTGDISDVVDLFEGTYTVKQIRDVYNKHREENQDYAKGGEITAEEREKGLKKYPKFNF